MMGTRAFPEPSRHGIPVLLVLVCLCLAAGARGAALPFTLHVSAGSERGATVLIIGGIQGDEPGGFNAASLLVTHYRMLEGRLWVVPNLNFESIIKRSRGVHGDMNRKFPIVSRDDPDYHHVERIKSIITREDVDYVFNLHDGSGFYREKHVDGLRNPRRWGQSIIIDQQRMDIAPKADLAGLARRVAEQVNRRLVDPEHAISVKNTRTREGNREMAKTLTYFAINEGKPAVGLEASKNLPTHMRVYYHLAMIEAYMTQLGLRFERELPLDPLSVKQAVDNNVKVAFYDRRLFLDMSRARSLLGYVPLKKGAELVYQASSPLVAILDGKDGYRVSYGNRRITRLSPQFFEYDDGLAEVALTVDGIRRSVPLGSEVAVSRRFSVEPPEGIRVNVIGWKRKGVRNESHVEVRRSQIARRFSVDRDATTFRVELYRGPKFAGMVLVRFTDATAGRSGDRRMAPSLAYNQETAQ